MKKVVTFYNEKIKCYSSFDKKTKKLINEITHASFLNFYADINNNYNQIMIENFYTYIEGCEYIIPSISSNHPKFDSKKYWRGPIWCIINFFLYIGFIKVNKNLSILVSQNTIKLIEMMIFLNI